MAQAGEIIDISSYLHLLQSTGNVLAIQGLNHSAADAGLLVLPEISQIVYFGLDDLFFAVPTPGSANVQETWEKVEGHEVQRRPRLLHAGVPTGAEHRHRRGHDPLLAQRHGPVGRRQYEGRRRALRGVPTSATVTLPGHGYANGALVLIQGADQPEYNGFFYIGNVTTDTFTYTVTGTPADTATGTITAQANYYTYTGPITIDRTAVVRTAAYKANYAPTDVDTATYIFTADVVQQSPTGTPAAGWPTGPINGQTLNYGMDPNIVGSGVWGPNVQGR